MSFKVLVLALLISAVAAEVCVLHCDDAAKCVNQKMRCDRFSDCEDQSDEIGCSYHPDHRPGPTECDFDCKKVNETECLQKDQVCDGQMHCSNYNDELNCTKEDYLRHSSSADPCLLHCSFGRCVFRGEVASCDCWDGYVGVLCSEHRYHLELKKKLEKEEQERPKTTTTEPSTPNSEDGRAEDTVVQCDNATTLDPKKVCNGRVDCADMADERNCTRMDYKKTRPDLQAKEICIMPCLNKGECRFDGDRALCKCLLGHSGVFCELTANSTQSQQHNASANGQADSNLSTPTSELKETKDISEPSTNGTGIVTAVVVITVLLAVLIAMYIVIMRRR